MNHNIRKFIDIINNPKKQTLNESSSKPFLLKWVSYDTGYKNRSKSFDSMEELQDFLYSLKKSSSFDYIPGSAQIFKPGKEGVRCGCHGPRRSSNCAYCGTAASDYICGVCAENGIDHDEYLPNRGIIKGTQRYVCKLHRKNPVTETSCGGSTTSGSIAALTTYNGKGDQFFGGPMSASIYGTKTIKRHRKNRKKPNAQK